MGRYARSMASATARATLTAAQEDAQHRQRARHYEMGNPFVIPEERCLPYSGSRVLKQKTHSSYMFRDAAKKASSYIEEEGLTWHRGLLVSG